MTIWQSVRIAWAGLVAQKLRSSLTMLGIIIGVAAVIALVAIGQGARTSIEGDIQDLGTNLIIVSPVRSAGGRLDLADVAEIRVAVPQAAAVVPVVSTRQTVRAGSAAHDTTVEGVTADYPAVRRYDVAQGQFLTAADVAGRRRVAVLGPVAAAELFGSASPVGRTVRIGGQPFTVVGLTAAKGSGLGGDNDDLVWIPVTVAQRLSASSRLSRLDVQAAGENLSAAAAQLLRDFYRLKLRRPDTVRVTSMEELLQTVDTVTTTLTVLLGAIAGISLVVGGIGIMNIMLVTVSERTREIGIRKAVGARKRHIAEQFLVESLVLSLTGGSIGIAVGFLLALAVRATGFLDPEVTAGAVALAFGFSAAVGVFFGLYPALTAANLDPIEALRRE